MTTTTQVDARELNKQLEPTEVLRFIGYHKTSPTTSGKEIRDYCPIHKGDKQKSLSISQENHTYICHSCGEKGDLIDLYAKSSSLEFRDAMEQLVAQFQPNYLSFTREPSSLPKPPHTTSNVHTNASIQDRWEMCSETGEHPYLSKKKISRPPGARFGKDDRGNHALVIPFYNVKGELQTIQFINEQGKFFLKGNSYKGSFFLLGDIIEDGHVYIAEGVATAMTIWEAVEKKSPVASVGSAGNLDTVATALHKKFPTKEIVLALDNNAAAETARDKITFPCKWCIPNFDGMKWDEENSPADFNDLISMCGQTLSVVREQLKREQYKNTDSFFTKLGRVIQDQKFATKLQERTYDSFENEHKHLFAAGGLITGLDKLDEHVYFSKGDFVTFQGMSNHGKSTLMLNVAYRFLDTQENRKKEPMCLFVTYESTPLRIEEKLLNIISHEYNEGTLIQYHRGASEKYSYPNRVDFKRTISTYNTLLKAKRIHILKRIPLEQLGAVIDLYKAEFQNRTIVIFLDYIQIIDTSLKSDGWEKIKNIAYALESLAIEKEVILAAASQVNEKRQAREGRDIFNASTINIDIFNHSHASVKGNEDLQKLYKDKVDGKNICTLEVRKQKHGPSFILEDYLLFNGHRFEEKKEPSKPLKQGKFDDLR